MTTRSKRTVAFALCGSFCSFAAVLPQLRALTARGWDVLPDQAIDAAAQQQNDRRMIDLLVCRRQGFAVINVIGPALSGSQSDHGRRHSYELKVARRVVQKYSGTMATEPRGELFAVKIVMPLTRG